LDTLLARDSGPEMAALWSDAKRHLRAALLTLTPREERIIRLRFGLDGIGEHTHEACDRSVSRERVRQIEARALRKLRHPKRSWTLPRPWTSASERHLDRIPVPVTTRAATERQEEQRRAWAEQQNARADEEARREAAWRETHEYASRKAELEAKQALIGKVSEEEFRLWLYDLYAHKRGTVTAMMRRAAELSPSSP
jgi:Sigma-70, region 4